MFTQCSKCETVFKLSAEVLRTAGGQVRCGKCGEVFNALAHLSEDAGAFGNDDSAIDLETRADRILENPAPMTPPRRAPEPEEFSPPGVEIARLQILDWNEDDLPQPQSPEPPAEESEQSADTSMEFTLPPGELDRIFIESKQREQLSAREQTPALEQTPRVLVEKFVGMTQTAPAAPAARVASGKSPASVSARAPAAAAAAAAAAATAKLPPHPEEIARVNASRQAAARLTAPSQGGFVSEDVRREMLSGIEEEDAATAEFPPPRLERRSRSRGRTAAPEEPAAAHAGGLWLGAAIASGLLLLAQLVHQNREWLAAHAPLGGALRGLYSTLGAPVPAPANLSAYQLRQWGVTGDPAADGTLRVRASILNTAAQLEPYPLLRVTLANRFGGSIGTRDFEPSEYLGRPTAKLLAPGERVDAIMNILDPGKNAEGFEIDVCLRGADRRISCANDAAAAARAQR